MNPAGLQPTLTSEEAAAIVRQLARAEEREECAKIADAFAEQYRKHDDVGDDMRRWTAASDIAQAIRARGQQ